MIRCSTITPLAHSIAWSGRRPPHQSRHIDHDPATSGLPLETDILRVRRHVSNVPTRDSCAAAEASLFDDLVGEFLKLQRDIETKRLCSLEIYHQLEFGGLLDWQIGGHDPMEDFVDVDRGSPVEII